ncbi:MAG TPA: SRPBCC family protein [Microlunatus sp.]|nr:SRPBCC family protein [Microlunatus sp.]
MDLVHRFSVQAPIEEAWYALNHIDRLAPCFPGASIDSFVGDEFTGSVKIKFGPTLDYKGSGTFTEIDDAEHRAVVEARGSDLRGGSGVLAKVTVQMWENGRLTDVEIKTDLGISGRPAQLGRGVVEDVSNKLMLAFVDRLQARFDAGIGRPDYIPPTPPPAPVAAPSRAPEPQRAERAAAPGAAAGSGPSTGAAPAASPVAGAAGAAAPAAPQYGTAFPKDEPALNVLTTVFPSVIKRYGLIMVAGTVILWLITRVVKLARKR